jgi:phospholipid/cholesterol/gamma-HCH transport system substrate-binding protein
VSAARGAVLGLLVAAVAVVAIVLLGGAKTTSYKLRFENAGQLVKGDDVQIGGRRIGSIDKIELTNDNQAEVHISVEDGFAPLHEGTTATIRATSLSGIANRYVALTPGANSRPKLDAGSTLQADKTTAPVDLDQLFATFDPKTRKSLQNVIKGSAQQYDGVAKQGNEALKYFNPALNSTSRLVNELISDQQVFQDFVVNSSKVVTSIAERRDDLSSLVTNSNTTAKAIADENNALYDALGILPGTIRKANTTFVNLRGTLGDLDTLVNTSKPATKELAPLLRELRPLVANARPTIKDLRTLIRKPGNGNDLVELLRKAPRLEQAAKPAFSNSVTALQKSDPVLAFIRPYTPDFTGWLRDFGQTTANYDANGHYARIQPIFNAFQLTDNTLTPIPNNQRAVGTKTGQFRRCPGTATQQLADKSNPWRDTDGKLDCDPTQVLPGP